MTEEKRKQRIVLGVTASIAIHRALDLTSELKKRGHRVHVVMTPSSKELVSPVTFQAFSHEKVHHDMWAVSDSFDHDHIRLAQEADLLVIAPTTAGTIGKLAHGILDNVLLTTAFAFVRPEDLRAGDELAHVGTPAHPGQLRSLAGRGLDDGRSRRR